MTQALITPTPPAGEEARVAGVLDAIQSHLGFVPDALKLYGISPPLLENFVGNISYFRGGTKLSPALTTSIRYLVSVESDCSFCIDMNEGFFANMGFDLETIRKARNNPDLAPVSEQERPLLKLALKAISSPGEVDAADMDAVRAQGWTDREMFDAVAQAAGNKSLNYLLRTFKVEHQGSFV